MVAAMCRPLPTPPPDPVRIVVSRMVARSLPSDDGEGDPVGVESTQWSAGSFQLSQNFTSDSVAGGPWLSKADRMMLRRWRRGVMNVATW